MSKLINRLEKLETQLKAHAKLPIWIDLFDNRVRVDIGGKRGEQLIFNSVFECVDWVEKQIIQFDKVTGFACFSDVSELFAEGLPRDMFNKVHEGAPTKSVIINLNGLNNFNYSITSAAFVSWRNSLTGIAYRDWWKEVLARADALSQSLEDEDEESDLVLNTPTTE